MQAAYILLIFVLVYIGMAAGRLPWLRVDRTGIALLGVVLLLAPGAVTLDDIGSNIDMPTLVLLFALMIISAQFVEAGFYDLCARKITDTHFGPTMMLALTVAVCGGLSAVLANDIIVLALVPLLIAGVQARGLDPRPFLLALTLSMNAGSAATIVGNPHNILIGEFENLGFFSFILACGLPAIISLIIVFVTVWLAWHNRMSGTVLAAVQNIDNVPTHPHDRNQTIKGLIATLALFALFMTSIQHEVGALIIAAILLANRKFTSRTMIAAVDWPLLLLFACLFGVTGAVADTGIPWAGISHLQEWGLMPDSLLVLTPLTLLMSNTIGNSPAVILLVKLWPNPPPGALYALALLSTLSGNLLLVGSLTNIMVVERAAAFGVRLSFGEYARLGIPITLLSMAFAVFWLASTGWLPVFPENW